MPIEELLTVEEVAGYLKLKARTLYPKIRKGEMPAIKVFSQYRFKKSDVDKWLSENNRKKEKQYEASSK